MEIFSQSQSSSKPFTYAVCLNELGRDTVHQYVGQEPSGRMFNELSLDNNSEHGRKKDTKFHPSKTLLISR